MTDEQWYRLPRGGGKGQRRGEAPKPAGEERTCHWYVNEKHAWRAAYEDEVRKVKPPKTIKPRRK